MEYSEGYWNNSDSRPTAPALTPEDVTVMVSLMNELRDMTQSRRTFVAATDFLKRFGGETDSPSLVAADALAQ